MNETKHLKNRYKNTLSNLMSTNKYLQYFLAVKSEGIVCLYPYK